LDPAPPPVSGGVVRPRHAFVHRLNGLRKRSPLNPYWIELRWLRRSVESLAPHARGLLLDVGVGERPYASLFEGRARRYLGLEYPPMADNLSPGIWQALHKLRGIIDVWGDGGRLPFRDQSIDTLLALEVLEHVPDPNLLLAEFARVLKPDGTLLLTVPFLAPLHQMPFDYYRYTPPGISSLLERQGFRVDSLRARGNSTSAAGVTLVHWLMRTLGARTIQHDGSVILSRWRAPFVLPLVALVQLAFSIAEHWTRDEGMCLGYFARASLTKSSSSGRSVTSQS
jgi:SAM-dependent methyltransferase